MPDTTTTVGGVEPVAWENDALRVTGPSGHAVTLRYTFGNLRAHDRAEPKELLDVISDFGLLPAVGFLRHFAEGDEGAPLYASESDAYEGLKALGFRTVRDAYIEVFNRLAHEMGFVTEGAETTDEAEPGKPAAT